MKEDYPVKNISSVATVIPGQSPKSSSYNNSGEGLPFYQGKKEYGPKYIKDPTTWTTQVTKVAYEKDLLISVRAPVGPVNYATQKCCIGRGLAAIRPNKSINHSYLYYFFLSKQNELGGTEGAVFASINKKQIESITVPVPPLPEQQRIVAILDQAFEGIATAKGNAEKDLQNARELLQSSLAALFEGIDTKKYLVEELAEKRKGTIRTGPFGSQLLHSEFIDDGIAVLGIDNAVNNEFRWGKQRFITPKKYKQLARYTVNPGDVIITIMGTCGRCAIVPDDIPTAINTKHLCCITLDKKKCLPEFLHIYFLFHPVALDYLTKQAKGAIMAGLNMGIIKELPVFLPSLGQQRSIVDAFQALNEGTQALERIGQQKFAALGELKQSLLHKAFAGEL